MKYQFFNIQDFYIDNLNHLTERLKLISSNGSFILQLYFENSRNYAQVQVHYPIYKIIENNKFENYNFNLNQNVKKDEWEKFKNFRNKSFSNFYKNKFSDSQKTEKINKDFLNVNNTLFNNYFDNNKNLNSFNNNENNNIFNNTARKSMNNVNNSN